MSRMLQYVGYGDSTGYGVAARALVRALREAGAEVDWCPMLPGFGRKGGYGLVSELPAAPEASPLVLHTVPEHYPELAARARRTAPGRPVWGHTVWETDRLPDHWPALLNGLDGVFVPSEWNRQVFRASGVTARIEVLPHVAPFGPEARRADGVPGLEGLDGRFVFYAVSMWTERKAPWYALRAFLTAFSSDDPVAFVLKTDGWDRTRLRRDWRTGFRRRHPRVREAVARELAAFPAAPPVVVLEGDVDEATMVALHARGDCYLSLGRAEGWGLGAYEAAWAGKPVVATAFGGHLCYLPADWPGLVEAREAPVRAAAHEASYAAEQRWSEPDLAQAAAAMRRLAGDPAWAAAEGRRLRAHVERGFDAGAIARSCLEALSV